VTRITWLFGTIATALLMGAVSAHANPSISPRDWTAFRSKFVESSGRVIDDGNGSISHSEGQGYGMLLAYLAGNRADFEQIWTFTRTELLLRDDGLAVWKWDPAAEPHVTDQNNATDGDILIAYALALAGETWLRKDLSEAGAGIAQAVGRTTIVESQGRKLLMPAVAGFGAGDREDGPVINLSYWIFEAFPVFDRLAPDHDWSALSRSGLTLLAPTTASPASLPPDWLSLRSQPKPARGFPAEFGYNALRIPLYLIRSGMTDRSLLIPFREAMQETGGAAVRIVEVPSGKTSATLFEPGYRAIPALIACVIDKQKFPADLKTFTPTRYYPSTLHLLVLSFATERHPECLAS
jgi:endoglucanase